MWVGIIEGCIWVLFSFVIVNGLGGIKLICIISVDVINDFYFDLFVQVDNVVGKSVCEYIILFDLLGVVLVLLFVVFVVVLCCMVLVVVL